MKETSGVIKYITLSREDATTPPVRDGVFTIMTDRYWRVDCNGSLLFYRTFAHPQCNPHKSIADRIIPGDRDTTVEFIPIVYVPYDGSGNA